MDESTLVGSLPMARMVSGLCLFLISLSFPAPSIAGSPWHLESFKLIKVEPTWGETKYGVREVYYPGYTFNGNPTRVFAYYGKPEGKGPFPTMLLVHGGGGTAFPDWVRHWTKRGYCALAMDLAGHGPKGRLEDGGPDQSDETKFKDFNPDRPASMWVYQAVAAVLNGHTMLATFPEVDKDRIGITGISWGGFLTCIIAGIDDRLKVAVPVYGCGFLHENSVWKAERFDKVPADRRDRWVKSFDPSSHLAGVQCPILFLNGTNDFAYPMDSYLKSYNLVKGSKNLSVRVRLPHGHIWTFPEVDAFVDAHLKQGKPLAKVGPIQKLSPTLAAVKVDSPLPIKGVTLNYAIAEGPWQNRQWKSVPAKKVNDRWEADLPADRPLVYYFLATDERGLETSSAHEIEEKPK